MNKYFEIIPYEPGFKDPFHEIARRVHMSDNELAKAIGFKNENDRFANLIFENMSDPAYIHRMNKFLKEKNLPLRISQTMPKRRYHDKAN